MKLKFVHGKYGLSLYVSSVKVVLSSVLRSDFAIIVSFVSSFLRLLMILLFKIKRYKKTFLQNKISLKSCHNSEGCTEIFMYLFKFPTPVKHFSFRLIYLCKFLVSKETVVLRRWESETII